MGSMIAALLKPACRSGGAGEPAGSSQTSGGAGEPDGEPCNCPWALGGDFNIGPTKLELLIGHLKITHPLLKDLGASDKVQRSETSQIPPG